MVHLTRGLLALTATIAFAGSALASPIGTQYPVTVFNFGGTSFEQSLLNFDGNPETVPGTSLSITENATELPDGSEFLEFTVESSAPFLDGVLSSGDNSGVGLGPISWVEGVGMTRTNSAFFYFTNDGTPLAMQDQLGLLASRGVTFGPHPFDPSISTVAFIPNAAETPVIVGIDTTVFDDPATPGADVPYGLVELAFGVAGQSANDLHLGIIVDHVPEPASALLLGLALGALGLARRRC